MEQLPDHPVIRWMERTGEPPRRRRSAAAPYARRPAPEAKPAQTQGFRTEKREVT